MQTLGVITRHFQPAAAFRSVVGKSCDDNVPTRFYGFAHSRQVAPAILGLCQKMEYCPVMPDIVLMTGQSRLRDIRLEPGDRPCLLWAESLLCHFQGRGRNIQDANALKSVFK